MMSQARMFALKVIMATSLCCFVLSVGAQDTDPSEVGALRAIRGRLVDPMKHLNWSKGDPCKSNWTGVLCFYGPLDDGHLHVQEILLLNMNLSGSLAPEIGQLSYMRILDFMWNKLSGNIPKEIGNIKSLELMLLNGNEFSGSLPEEFGFLPNLSRIQIDSNKLSGSLPKSFANLKEMRHIHLNNNSISGQIPPELHALPKLVHLLLDNNNLSGYLPEEFSMLPALEILQLDNNNFSGSLIPASYGNMSRLLKLSLRNCRLQGPVPDLSKIPELGYLDLSWNSLTGTIPSNRLSLNITTIILSNNQLNGSISRNFSGLPILQILSLENNLLTGSVPSNMWQNMTFNGTQRLILDFENNSLTNISGIPSPPANVTIMLQGNPVCGNANALNISQFCGFQDGEFTSHGSLTNSPSSSCPQSCLTIQFYEYVPTYPIPCFCAAPIKVGYRMKSPGFSNFLPYMEPLERFLANGLQLNRYQLYMDSFAWENGPRLMLNIKLYPDNFSIFNVSEILRIRDLFTGWHIPHNDVFGPFELLSFTLLGPYAYVIPTSQKSGLSRGSLAGILIGTIVGTITLSAAVSLLIKRRGAGYRHTPSRKRLLSRVQMKVDGVKGFNYKEMSLATNNFSDSAQVGQGGYGKVYRGNLADGSVVAIKRAQEDSLQGSKEFFTELELLSRLHHRNLVSLVGYCDEANEQVNTVRQSGMLSSIVDSRMGDYPSDCLEKFADLALKCCQHESEARPSITEVVRELEMIMHMISESDVTPSDTNTSFSSGGVTPVSSSSMPTGSASMISSSITSTITSTNGSDPLSGGVSSTIVPR
ncbi:putative LRR receptor-like serine/threonine-protein kinase [Acorus gramineus]|uniref:non-specific serine/threonine protein kinase n=1 Tax=Acorus gramineus TaxID=55184 RepID=A0AAV9AM61_ACOGR|nr:putative LRR receptor-like serine/threonine-protein kinase [Acorus gramineus]